MSDRKILVTGVTGYIGPILARRLVELGYQVRCLVRNPARLGDYLNETCDVATGDVLDFHTLPPALKGIEAAYYLIHSMASGEKEFGDLDRIAAANFGRAAKAAGVKRIIFLGGYGREDHDLSPHLRSRHETGKVLSKAGVPVTEFRAGSIIGSGSLSFEIIRYLVERLPVMICPRWTVGKTQPIAIDDVLRYLTESLELPETVGRVLEIGGADIITYADMMLIYARLRGLKRLLVNVPVLSPRLSSYWVGLVTPLPSSVVKPIILGLKTDLYCHDDSARRIFSFEPMGYEEAVRRALDSPKEKILGAKDFKYYLKRKDKPQQRRTVVHAEGIIAERIEMETVAQPESVFAVLTKLGGEYGWPGASFLWGARMLLDRLLGGKAVRFRSNHESLKEGDLIDFWQVEKVVENRHLWLRNSIMKMPGRVWLQFDVEDRNTAGSKLIQTVFFEPRGLAGVLYWYLFYPLHKLVFQSLITGIVNRAD